jgi:hypothetical protein
MVLQSDSYAQLAIMGFLSFLVLGFVPFIGIVIAESVYRLSKILQLTE